MSQWLRACTVLTGPEISPTATSQLPISPAPERSDASGLCGCCICARARTYTTTVNTCTCTHTCTHVCMHTHTKLKFFKKKKVNSKNFLKDFFYFTYMDVFPACMFVYTCMPTTCEGSEEAGIWSPGTGVMRSCESTGVCWELNVGPPQSSKCF